jgi:hypothetical protein
MTSKIKQYGKKLFLQPEPYILLIGFLLNYLWEVSQIPFYLGYNRGRYWFGENTIDMKIYFVITFLRAGFLDGILILCDYWLLSIIYWDRYWFIKGGTFFNKGKKFLPLWGGYLIASIAAILFLAFFETLACIGNWYGYSEIMPMIGPCIGLVPLLAFIWTPTITYLLARRIYIGSAIKKLDTEMDIKQINDGEKALVYINKLKKLLKE